jgi:imidazolonepropionase-like amidohydrolase
MIAWLCVLGALAPTSEPAATVRDGAAVFAIRADLVRVDGARVIEHGVLLVDAGRIRSVGGNVDLPEGVPLIEHEGAVSAGLVAARAFSGARGETLEGKRAFTPDARMIEVFEPSHPDCGRALAAGITTMVLTPSIGNVVAGRTAVVKTAGGAVIEREGHLALSLTASALRFNRYPTSYASAVEALEAELAGAQGVWAQVASGEVPLWIGAVSRHEIERVVDLATRRGLRGVIDRAPLAGELAPALAKSRLGVVLDPLEAGTERRTLEAARALADAKVAFAFGADTPWSNAVGLRFSVAQAVRAGVDPALAWDAVSATAAQLAGVGDRVGKLERGYDADLVLWSGDPLDLTSRVVAVYVDGKLAFGGAR